MGIFESEAKAMIEEEKAELHKQAALQAAQHELAQHIRDDLESYARAAQRTDIELVSQDKHVHVRLRTTSDTLVITCEGPDAFKCSTQKPVKRPQA